MRAFGVLAAVIASALLAAACGAAGNSGSNGPARQAMFAHRAGVLEARWNTDVNAGVPAAHLAPLRRQLAASPFSAAPATASIWANDDGHLLLDSLDRGTASIWTAAISAARGRATAVLAAWRALTVQFGASVPADAAAAAGDWPTQLADASTPAAIDRLTSAWSDMIGATRTVAAAAVSLGATLAPYGGVAGLEATATTAVAQARADHLQPGSVESMVGALRAAAAAGQDITPAVSALLGPLTALRALVSEDAAVAAQLGSLQQLIRRAASMNTSRAASFPATYASIVSAFQAATVGVALNAVGGRIGSLQGMVTADINAATSAAAGAASAAASAQMQSTGCGHAVPRGRVVVISLGQQSAAYYQDTCLVNTSLVTTGRPGMRTPMGTFHIFEKHSPARFVSGYLPGSPRYYTPETAQFAMQFLGGGFLIHDAPWEPGNGFGPGSQNGPSASHGCVHIPSPVMAWLYSWAGVGTTVIITG